MPGNPTECIKRKKNKLLWNENKLKFLLEESKNEKKCKHINIMLKN